MWHLYAQYGRGNARYAGLGGVATLVGRLFGLVPAFVIGLAVDAIFLDQRPYRLPFVPDAWIPASPADRLWLSIGVLVAATLLGAAVTWVQDWSWSVFAQRVQHGLRVDAYAKMQAQELSFFTGRRTGELMSILNNDVNALQTFLEDGLSSTLWVAGTVVGIGLILFSLNPPLAAVTLLPIPVLAAFTLVFTRVIEPMYLRVRGEIGDLNSRLENNIGGIEVIKTENAERYEVGRVESSSLEYLTANLAAIRAQITYFPGLNVISGVGFAVTFAVGGLWVLRGPPFGLSASLTPGEFVTFVIYAQQFVWPIIQFGNVVDDYERATAASTRVYDLMVRPDEDSDGLDGSGGPERLDGRYEPGELDGQSEPGGSDGRDRADGRDLSVREGRIEYDEVSFAYRDDAVLSDVSFVANGGETVGIVGPTGAGKSTLVKLLPRLYDVDEGAIRIDGRDVRDVSLGSLRRSIGYVSQEPFLFYGSVRENIAYGTFGATDEAVVEAAKRAQAHEFVRNLPDGYDTLVGERGVRLSGGQRQRIVIARTILKDPTLLVLDEATSHVDTETEALIQRSLDRVAEGRTTFVVAHRLSTVRRADTILVVDDGRIVERGTHEELLAVDGLYANFWRVQAGELQDLPIEFIERAIRRQSAVELDALDDGDAED